MTTLKTELTVRIAELTTYALAHKFVKDKSPEGIASRVARALNREGYACVGAPYFTRFEVLALATPKAVAKATK